MQLGALLQQEGLLTQARLDAALAEQRATAKPLGRILIEAGVISESDLVRMLARQVGLDFVDLGEASVDPSVATLIPEALARRYQALPIQWDEGRLIVAMADPSNVFAVDDIRALTASTPRSTRSRRKRPTSSGPATRSATSARSSRTPRSSSS
jgi:type IV pilus assembly protein PilB